MRWNCNISICLQAYECSSVDVFIWCVKGTLCDIKFIFKTWILTHAICARIFAFSPLLIVCVAMTAPRCMLRCFSADLRAYFHACRILRHLSICIWPYASLCVVVIRMIRICVCGCYIHRWKGRWLYELYIKRTKSEHIADAHFWVNSSCKLAIC